jgi:hypothetical protein
MITMAHPDRMLATNLPKPLKQRTGRGDIKCRPPKFAACSRFNPPPKLGAHGLLAIANAKNRNAKIKNNLWRARCIGKRNRIWPTR